jgi:hypothetical protein
MPLPTNRPSSSPRAAWRLLLICLSLLAVAGLGCAEDAASGEDGLLDDEPLIYVPEGKADDYRSTTGQEYALVALDTITLTGSDLALTGDARTARAEELMALRFKAISFFAYEYLAGKSSHDANFNYGNFRTTVRQQTFEGFISGEREDAPGTFEFLFAAEAAGPMALLRSLPLAADGKTFPLPIPTLSNAELESGSYTRTYSAFDAAKFPAEKVTAIDIEISPKASEPDAYPEYSKLFEDGVLDVAIHVGGDYNAERYDLTTARDIFKNLSASGFKAPAESFDALRTDSGPFTKDLDANGKTVRVEVYLYHPDMNAEAGVGYAGLINLYKQSAATRDVVVYDGHAGYDTTYSGVVVHYNPRHAIAADAFQSLPLPDKYQLFFFNGCKTYTAYADALYKNPAKTTANLDIISTVNFAWLSEMTRVTTDFVGQLTVTSSKQHVPRSYDRILAELNKGASRDVIYGIHGLSDNGRVSPYADLGALCAPCKRNSECSGADNLCVTGLNSKSGCAVACTDTSGCPEGYRCSPVSVRNAATLSGSQCLPIAGKCQ